MSLHIQRVVAVILTLDDLFTQEIILTSTPWEHVVLNPGTEYVTVARGHPAYGDAILAPSQEDDTLILIGGSLSPVVQERMSLILGDASLTMPLDDVTLTHDNGDIST